MIPCSTRHRRIATQLAALLATILLATTPVAADDPLSPATQTDDPFYDGVQFSLDFAGAAGAALTTVNGQDPQHSGEPVGTYAATAHVAPGQPAPLVLRITEDPNVNGPDGQPGLLRLQFVALPFEAVETRFTVAGTKATGPITLSDLKLGNVTPDDLSRTFVEFKFRADNPTDGDTLGGLYQFRLEPTRDDDESYGRRADFGTLVVTSRWRTFRRPVSSANNLDWFLTSLNEDNPTAFQLIWAQNGPIHAYSPGSSLLIDDLKIVIEP